MSSRHRNGRSAWTRDELHELKRLYGSHTDKELARRFGRSETSIKRMAGRLALAKDKAFLRRIDPERSTRMPRWTEPELERLVELYPHTPNLEIARNLQRSVKSIVSKAHHLQLRKCEDRLREMGRENVALRQDR